MGLFSGITDAFSGLGGALVGGASQLLGGLMTNQAQRGLASSAQDFSAAQTAQQMNFQERMRATQYQTAIEDLKAAGLNPMLAYTQGGAGTPSGGAAVGQQATLRNPAEGLASSASMIANIKADVDKKEAETVESISRTGVNDEQRKLISAQTYLAILEAPNVSQKLKNMVSEELLNQARTTATSAQETATRLDTMIRTLGDLPEAKVRGKYAETAGILSPMLKDIGQATSSAAAGASAIRGISNPFRIETNQPMPNKFRR